MRRSLPDDSDARSGLALASVYDTRCSFLWPTLGESLPMSEMRDVLIVGAGPTGLACGIEAVRAGLDVLILEKGCLVNSLFSYPANMTFFTTRERLEIGGLPFASVNVK